MGRAHRFFETIITAGHEKGLVVFVMTKRLAVAQYFQYFNGGSKAKTFKQLTTANNPTPFTCQFFDWNRDKRLDFLKLYQAKQKGPGLTDTELEKVVNDNITADENIRELIDAYEFEIVDHQARQAMQNHALDEDEPWQSWFMGLFSSCMG